MKFLSLGLLCLGLFPLGGCAQWTKNSNPESPEAVKAAIAEDLNLIPRGIDFSHAPDRVAFGSCANQDAPQPLWNTIESHHPDLFLFMGDNIYASKPEQQPLADQYRKLGALKEFRSAREKIPFMVTWDDNDYGKNDGGADYLEKEISKKEFLKFWPYVKDSLSLNQGGIYHAKLIGGAKKKSPIVQVIMLDTRYFRSPLIPANEPEGKKKYAPNRDPKATLLGEQQWAWLEEQFQRPADVRLVVSSIQMIPETPGFEKWANFPLEKERFFQLLKKTQVRNVFILSGDRHIGVISKQEVKGWGQLYEITASSINKPSDWEEADPSYQGLPYNKENFGLVSFDWKKRRAVFELRDLGNEVKNRLELPLRN